MSLLWAQAANPFGADSEVYHHDHDERPMKQASDLPLRFDYEDKGNGQGLWKAKVPSDHPGHETHGWTAGYAHTEFKDLPDDHPDDPGGWTTHIRMIETNPGYEGHGVAKALLQHVINQSGWRGVTHGQFSEGGAKVWESVTGQKVRSTPGTVQGNHKRDWRWFV